MDTDDDDYKIDHDDDDELMTNPCVISKAGHDQSYSKLIRMRFYQKTNQDDAFAMIIIIMIKIMISMMIIIMMLKILFSC